MNLDFFFQSGAAPAPLAVTLCVMFLLGAFARLLPKVRGMDDEITFRSERQYLYALLAALFGLLAMLAMQPMGANQHALASGLSILASLMLGSQLVAMLMILSRQRPLLVRGP